MSSGEAGSEAPHDEIGRMGIPEHYAGEREVIDIIRDKLGDEGFVAYCHGAVIKYRRRAGKKAGETADKDNAKADWYAQMIDHVEGRGLDPRAVRPGFVPYSRPVKAPPKRWRLLNAPPTVSRVEFRRLPDQDRFCVWVRADGFERMAGYVTGKELDLATVENPLLIDCSEAFQHAYDEVSRG